MAVRHNQLHDSHLHTRCKTTLYENTQLRSRFLVVMIYVNFNIPRKGVLLRYGKFNLRGVGFKSLPVKYIVTWRANFCFINDPPCSNVTVYHRKGILYNVSKATQRACFYFPRTIEQ